MKRPTLRIVLGILVLAAFVILVRMLPVAQWLEQFKSYVKDAGALGYVLYVLVYVACVVLVIPALALTLGAGAIFGWVKGSIVNMIAGTLGATAAFLLARTVLRHRVEGFMRKHPQLAAVDRAVEREGVKIMLLVRIGGFPPFTWVNYAFGLTGISFGKYFVTTVFGIIPGTLAFTYAGAAGSQLLMGGGNRVVLIITAVAALAVLIYIARLATKAIRSAGVNVDEA
ncbi:MAG TPA: TVP38/TMEM64 family protein [Thermoanaerobaculia bacterium]|nr:TVP38/TMEM64 family protein [Thermoanaerobaculia bacterium]